MAGFIKIYRSIRKHWLWSDAKKLQWWLDILMTVNYEDRKVLVKSHLIECKRGQSVQSLDNWARQWRTTKPTVSAFFKLLQSDGMVLTENLSVTSRITVCNYDSYNVPLDDNFTEPIPQPLSLPLRVLDGTFTQLKKDKKGKKEKNIELVAIAPNSCPIASDGSEKHYSSIEKDIVTMTKFIINFKPNYPAPYFDYWNLFAEKYKKPKIEKITETRKKHLICRLKEPKFNLPEILKISKDCNLLLQGGWFTMGWLIESENNYLKVLEGNYKNTEPLENSKIETKTPSHTPEEVKRILAERAEQAKPKKLNVC